MNNDMLTVKVTAKEVYRRKLLLKTIKLAIVIILLFFSILYLSLYVINSGGYFTITLDPKLKNNKNILMSSYEDFERNDVIIKVKGLGNMDNITESWIPIDIPTKEGDNSSDNYIAYTFFIKNAGESTIDYVREIRIDSVIKNVDEAVRVALYYNGEKTLYAKKSATGTAEEGTIAFMSNYKVFRDIRKDFAPKEVDRYTVVIWLEGNDPECIDDILGGEMKMSMIITEDS